MSEEQKGINRNASPSDIQLPIEADYKFGYGVKASAAAVFAFIDQTDVSLMVNSPKAPIQAQGPNSKDTPKGQ